MTRKSIDSKISTGEWPYRLLKIWSLHQQSRVHATYAFLVEQHRGMIYGNWRWLGKEDSRWILFFPLVLVISSLGDSKRRFMMPRGISLEWKKKGNINAFGISIQVISCMEISKCVHLFRFWASSKALLWPCLVLESYGIFIVCVCVGGETSSHPFSLRVQGLIQRRLSGLWSDGWVTCVCLAKKPTKTSTVAGQLIWSSMPSCFKTWYVSMATSTNLCMGLSYTW